jgi:ribonucleoside-diphosphate reductase alpha chain
MNHRNGNGTNNFIPQDIFNPNIPKPTAKTYESVDTKNIKNCPECGCEVEHEGGCVVCRSCGYSKCG